MPLSEVKEFFVPQEAGEVAALLARFGNRAVVLAGGTFLHGLAARGLLHGVDAFIYLGKAGLSYVKQVDGVLAVGAMTTFTELGSAEPVRNLPALGAIKDALQYPPAQIRNMATVGGCVASASPLFDLPVAFLALDGTVKALGPKGEREIALRKFYLDYFEHALEKNEFLTQVRLPKAAARSASAFLKLDTNANDLALLNVGVCVTLDASGNCRDVRVALGGGIGKIPVRAAACEAVLNGQRPTRERVSESAQVVSSDIHTVSDHRASAQYRTAAARVLVKRALGRALSRLGVEVN
jgi:carbon-monoxide dehydrogenase medium subunit